jgi:hypothetical protein
MTERQWTLDSVYKVVVYAGGEFVCLHTTTNIVEARERLAEWRSRMPRDLTVVLHCCDCTITEVE